MVELIEEFVLDSDVGICGVTDSSMGSIGDDGDVVEWLNKLNEENKSLKEENKLLKKLLVKEWK